MKLLLRNHGSPLDWDADDVELVMFASASAEGGDASAGDSGGGAVGGGSPGVDGSADNGEDNDAQEGANSPQGNPDADAADNDPNGLSGAEGMSAGGYAGMPESQQADMLAEQSMDFGEFGEAATADSAGTDFASESEPEGWIDSIISFVKDPSLKGFFSSPIPSIISAFVPQAAPFALLGKALTSPESIPGMIGGKAGSTLGVGLGLASNVGLVGTVGLGIAGGIAGTNAAQDAGPPSDAAVAAANAAPDGGVASSVQNNGMGGVEPIAYRPPIRPSYGLVGQSQGIGAYGNYDGYAASAAGGAYEPQPWS